MGTPCISQRKVNQRLLLLTCGFTGTAAAIPARKIKPVLINSDSHCLELKIRSCRLRTRVEPGFPGADPRAAVGFSVTRPPPFPPSPSGEGRFCSGVAASCTQSPSAAGSTAACTVLLQVYYNKIGGLSLLCFHWNFFPVLAELGQALAPLILLSLHFSFCFPQPRGTGSSPFLAPVLLCREVLDTDPALVPGTGSPAAALQEGTGVGGGQQRSEPAPLSSRDGAPRPAGPGPNAMALSPLEPPGPLSPCKLPGLGGTQLSIQRPWGGMEGAGGSLGSTGGFSSPAPRGWELNLGCSVSFPIPCPSQFGATFAAPRQALGMEGGQGLLPWERSALGKGRGQQ